MRGEKEKITHGREGRRVSAEKKRADLERGER